MIYLDNSATSFPKPKTVYDSYSGAIKYYHSNPGRGGYENSLQTAEAIYNVREKTADFFGASQAENVVFTQNCTMAENMVIKGILQPGDHVLISDLEHNSVVRPLEKLRLQNRITYDLFHVDFYAPSHTLREIESKIRPNTKLLFCLHASNVLGVVLPIRNIGKICRKHNILFAVDAAQSGGILPLHMQDCSIDYLCLACHKGLFSPMGLGALICQAELPETLVEGGTGSLSLQRMQPTFLPDKLESGTLNVCGIIAMGAGIDFIRNAGRENILQQEKKHIIQLHNELSQFAQIQTYVDVTKLKEFSPVFAFNIKDKSSETVADLLAKKEIAVRGGFQCSLLAHKKIGTENCGVCRISPSFFTKRSDINYVISTIKNMI